MKLAADARVAVYYAPAENDPLWIAGSRWLGRDAQTGAALVQPPVPDLPALTRGPCGYGLHATLKAPFRLGDGVGWKDLCVAVEQAAAGCAVLPLPRLRVGVLDGFVALLEHTPAPALHALADRMVAALDPLRAPLTAAELHRRRAEALSPAAEAMLVAWGYPYVFSEWHFHMTLSERLNVAQQAFLLPHAELALREACAIPREVRDVCLFVQPARGQPFRLAARIRLG